LDTLNELLHWLVSEHGKIGILDATNSTIERRKIVSDHVKEFKGVSLIFIESICDDPIVLERNIQMKLKGPDYVNVPTEQALDDFRSRIKNYEKAYETIDQQEENEGLSYIKIINIGKKVITHNIKGYLQSHCVFYLMQMNIKDRTIWLTRHGESEFNVKNRIGGDACLTERGKEYARGLAEFLQEHYGEASVHESMVSLNDGFGLTKNAVPLTVWTSALLRTMQTAEHFNPDIFEVLHVRSLNEVFIFLFILRFMQANLMACYFLKWKRNIPKNGNQEEKIS
jgi:6-phosphofructo-2-kinase